MEETIKLPDLWEGWEITELIGSGSYGDVYKAVYRGADPSVIPQAAAVKIIRIPSGSAEAAALAHEIPDKEDRILYCQNIIDGLLSEIRTMETLKDNDHVVAMQDYYVDYNEEIPEWTIYIRMELLMPLSDYMVTHAPEEKWVVRLGIEMCDALEECAENDILHRDIKPENILVAEDGTFRLGDFGVARQMDLTTASLSLKGTFTYMAPEIYHGEKYGVKTDQYSLGIVLYRLMNRNRDPFVDPASRMVYYKDREDALRRRMSGEQLPLPADASEKLASVILRACAYSPEARYERIFDMKHDLLVCAGELPIAGRKDNAGSAAGTAGAVGSASLVGVVSKTGPIEAVSEAGDGKAAGISGRMGGALKLVSKLKNRKSLLVGIPAVILAMLVALFLTGNLVLARGRCGDSLKWTVTSNEVMTISGKGMMNSYELLHPSPWRALDLPFGKEIREVNVREGVTGIGSYAFRMNNGIRNMQLPDSLEFIGDGAFSNCWTLSSITLDKNVAHIGKGVFESCLNLKTITVDVDNPQYDSRDYCNAVIETSTDTLVAGCSGTTIPEGIRAIGPYAFSGILSLKDINIPDSVESIDDTAFEGCSDDLVIHGSDGSVAKEYAKSHAIRFRER